ncbi:MAG TPA: hydroxymethylglutaryl-CoA synthase family protein [Steroidobacteraceae bacterium]|jgi:polyketide biosynthesis 3-hydroxy-3-methylglutaryl-CoA synthase-like enzyme PksG
MTVGIEALNVFAGSACIDVGELARHRQLDAARFDNLLMKEKTVALPDEDPVTYAVNAAQPLVEALPAAERNRIELLITCTESGIDFGKSISTYVHHHLGLARNCRLFEIKQACYSGTAGLQMAAAFVLSQAAPGAKALVVTTDLSRVAIAPGGEGLSQDWSFAEPSGGAGAVAMLIGEQPAVFELDVGASGYYGYEVMDTCRPTPDSEAGNTDLSLMSYLDCCESCFVEYCKRVQDVDYERSFQQLAFHTPFGGMVKGAHRTMMRRHAGASPARIEADFSRRVAPGLTYCQRVGNIMGGTLYLALASAIENATLEGTARIGCFSYGSGCCSEFFSGVVTPSSRQVLRRFGIRAQLERRRRLSIPEYESLLRREFVRFGTRDAAVDDFFVEPVRGVRRLHLRGVREFHREYGWTP